MFHPVLSDLQFHSKTNPWQQSISNPAFKKMIKPKLSDFLLDLHRPLAHQGSAKILDISMGMPVVFANPYASRFQHISSQKSLNSG
jgi:hypothetical protein